MPSSSNHFTDEEAKQGRRDCANSIGVPLEPEDIADAILYACQVPQRVCIREIVIRHRGPLPSRSYK